METRLLITTGILLYVAISATAQQKQRSPNIIVVLADQLRYDVLGCKGDSKAITPHIDKFKSESVDFVNAVAVTPVSSACRASLFTGKYTSSTGMVVNELRINPNHYSLAQVLTDNGYNTSYIGKWHLYSNCSNHDSDECAYIPPGPYRLGFDGEWKSYNFHHDNMNSYYYENEKEKKYYGSGTYEPEQQFNMAICSLERLKQENKPFMLFLSVGIPHDPWSKENVPQVYYNQFKNIDFPLPENWSDIPDKYMDRNTDSLRWLQYWKKEIPEMKRVYYSMVTSLDDNLGRLMACVSSLGLDDNTIIVFMSDHGEMFGENGRVFKLTFYESSVRVPLMIRWKNRIKEGVDLKACINTPDVMPTLLGLCNQTIPDGVEGEDLSSYLLGRQKAGPKFAFMQGMGHTYLWQDGFEWRAVRDGQYTYAIYLVDGKECLFDNRNDPKQMRNLSQDSRYHKTLINMRKRLLTKRRELQDEFKPCTWYRDNWVDENRCVKKIP